MWFCAESDISLTNKIFGVERHSAHEQASGVVCYIIADVGKCVRVAEIPQKGTSGKKAFRTGNQ